VAYATADELFDALRVTSAIKRAEARPLADASLAAAAAEIDQVCGRLVTDQLPVDPPDPLAHMVNLARGVEWYKASDAAFGGSGSSSSAFSAYQPTGSHGTPRL